MNRRQNQVDAVEPALPGHRGRPLEGEAPKALRGWVNYRHVFFFFQRRSPRTPASFMPR